MCPSEEDFTCIFCTEPSTLFLKGKFKELYEGSRGSDISGKQLTGPTPRLDEPGRGQERRRWIHQQHRQLQYIE
jgi:hypothetical protein